MSASILVTQKLSELLDDQHYWGSYVLYGESIPHLLHWDWAYLWILDRQSTIPPEWQARVEAWRRLLCMLLLGELELEARAIEQPLLSYTEKAGFNHLVFARAPLYPGFPIGVLSPTVLVRPLPEPNRFEISSEKLAEQLPRHYSPPPNMGDRRAELLQSLDLVKVAIRDSGSQLSATLLRLIERYLPATEFPRINSFYPVTPLPNKASLVAKADASAWEDLRYVNITIFVPQRRVPPPKQFVPKCQGCGALLTYAKAESAVDAAVNISLRCRACEAITPFEYSDFGIWKHGNTFFIWRELEQLEGLGHHAIPPSPVVSNDEVCFSWNPALLGGEEVRAHVRLRFPQHQIRAIGISEIKYNMLLIPGDLTEGFNGLPVRPEWMFAVDQLPEVEIVNDVITFRNSKLHGLRHTVLLGRYPRAACRIAPDFQVGIFPTPLYEGWRRYRFFWSGDKSDEYRGCVVPDRGQPAVEKRQSVDIAEWDDGLPDALAIEAKSQAGMPASIGATWLLQKPRAADVSQPIYVGVDFGTTSSVVYAESQDGRPVVLELRDFARTAKILSGNGEPRTTFLPRTDEAAAAGFDPTLIPSALWFAPGGEFNPIRWSRRGPTKAHSARYGFKWGNQDELLRRQYLDELLFLVLPTALNKLFPGSAVKGNWNIGFAFPLAFSGSQRKEYAKLFTELRQGMDRYSSAPVDLKSISESHACVRAFGEHLHGSVFLIADLGGGSLDVALFETMSSPDGRPVTHHFQVGSAKIGGEAFVSALAHGMGADDEARQRHYWNIRYAIMTGRVAQDFPGSNFGNVATRFLPIAQELLRIMVEAFRAAIPDRNVDLVLVGNGWRIAEFTAATPLAQSIGRRELEESFQEFEVPNLSMYAGELEVPIKHVVALGALKNARPGGRNEIEEPHEAKMPSGRDLKLRNTGGTIRWCDLVGSAVRNLPIGTTAGHIEIHRASGPRAPARWLQRLDYAVPALDSNPTDAYVRDHFDIPGERLEKGPLQIILEKRAAGVS